MCGELSLHKEGAASKEKIYSATYEEIARKERSMPIGIRVGASVPKSNPRLLSSNILVWSLGAVLTITYTS